MNQEAVDLIKQEKVEAFNQLRLANGKEQWDLSNQDFSNLNLDNILLAYCDLSNSKFMNTSLNKAIFCRSTLNETFFEMANLQNTSFGPPELMLADLAMSDLGSHLMYGANMDHAWFSCCDMRGANMRETSMTKADFSGSKLEGANFKRANKEDAIFDKWDGLADKNKAAKLSYYKNLVKIAYSDNDVNRGEAVFLNHLAERLGLTEADHQFVLDNLDTIQFVVPDNKEEVIQQFRDILMMMVIDGDIKEAEYNIVVEYGQKLGFDKSIIDNMLSTYSNS